MKSSVIDLPRKKEEIDLFGIQKYQDALVEFIKNSNTPLTFALQGEWGSGKTSLMNLLEDELCDKGTFYRVWINSWQYSLMKTPEEAILKIVEGMIEQILKTLSSSQGKSDTVIKMKSLFNKITISGGKFLAKQIVDKVGGNADFVDGLFGGEGSDGAEISQLKKEIEGLIKEVLEKSKDKNKKGFLFFIDDLDRIDPPIAVQILELLKNIFDLDKCIFILAIDYDVVIKGLEPKFGKLTDKNEREFRSFFDKIIQMPFSMPVASYTINVFLIDALKNIGFINEEKAKDEKYTELLSELASLSVGQNPRALKRLTNTLSLINILNNKENEARQEDANEKLIGFSMVCLQIAYPLVYNKLIQDTDFVEWNDETAIKLRLDKLTPEQMERLNNTEEFDEDWEKVLFQICQKETHSSNRVFQISTLLNKVKELIPKDQELGKVLESILEQSAITNLMAFDKPKVIKNNRADIQNNLKEYIQTNLPAKLKEPLVQVIKILSKGDDGRFIIRTGVSKDQLKNWWIHSINVLVTSKEEKSYFAISFSCERWPKSANEFIEANKNNYNKCLEGVCSLSKKYYNNSFSIIENVRSDSKVVYQIKSTIEFIDDINSEKNTKTLVDFIAEWASITVDFSKKIGW